MQHRDMNPSQHFKQTRTQPQNRKLLIIKDALNAKFHAPYFLIGPNCTMLGIRLYKAIESLTIVNARMLDPIPVGNWLVIESLV